MLRFQFNIVTLTVPALCGLVALGVACTKQDAVANNSPTAVVFSAPAHFPKIVYDTASNRLTREGFELGRRLFYDVKLSRNLTISCGFCHMQSSAFTHHGHDVSHGIDDRLGIRNAPPTFNMAWARFFFWDGSVTNLDLQPLVSIKAHEKMDEDINNVVKKLEADAGYRSQFGAAFGNSTVTAQNMLKALSQFMVQCVSAGSRYDQWKEGKGALNDDELAGMRIVQQKCTPCHGGELFTDGDFHNNGLPPTVVDDKGRSTVTLNAAHNYLFKTPTLRNLKYTAPYMHDGRFSSLTSVLSHYGSGGVQNSPTLDPILKRNNPMGIPLTGTERRQLLLFLDALNDDALITDKRFSEQ